CRQPRTNAGDEPGVVGQVRGTIDVMPDLMGQNLRGEIAKIPLGNLPQADDDRMVNQPDHRKASGELMLLLLFRRAAPDWFPQLHKATPYLQCSGPPLLPAAVNLFERR